MKRHLFALPATPVYLSGASRSPLPRVVLLAGQRALRRKAASPWSIAGAEHARVDELLRAQWAQLLNASADLLAFAPSWCVRVCSSARRMRRRGSPRPLRQDASWSFSPSLRVCSSSSFASLRLSSPILSAFFVISAISVISVISVFSAFSVSPSLLTGAIVM